jgi:hypothetical protein
MKQMTVILLFTDFYNYFQVTSIQDISDIKIGFPGQPEEEGNLLFLQVRQFNDDGNIKGIEAKVSVSVFNPIFPKELDTYKKKQEWLQKHPELLQGLGVPTGTLPDGSPNLMLLYNLVSNKGVDNENAENGKIEGVLNKDRVTVTGKYR